MRIKIMLQTTAVLGLAVVVGLLGVGGTWALWNVSASTNAGTIQSASLDVLINGDSASTTTAVQMTAPSGKLTPDSPVYSSFKITNENNAGSDLRVNVTFGSPSVSDDRELQRYLRVDLAVEPPSGVCSAARFDGLPNIELGQNQHKDLCVRVSLKDEAPSGLSGSEAVVGLQVTATQITTSTST